MSQLRILSWLHIVLVAVDSGSIGLQSQTWSGWLGMACQVVRTSVDGLISHTPFSPVAVSG